CPMSDPIDEQGLEEYLQGRTLLSRRYRELGGEEVPAQLDQSVLRQARDALERSAVQPGLPAPGATRSRRWLRWSAPVGLAAAAVLALSVVLQGGMPHVAPSDAPRSAVQADEMEAMRESGDDGVPAVDRSRPPVEPPAAVAAKPQVAAVAEVPAPAGEERSVASRNTPAALTAVPPAPAAASKAGAAPPVKAPPASAAIQTSARRSAAALPPSSTVHQSSVPQAATGESARE